jgi:hypothetical protein
MTSSDWSSCIITSFDLVGTKSLAASGRGSSRMIEMRSSAVEQVNHGMPLHSHGYVFNDSVLLLTYETQPAAKRRRVLLELDEFKSILEQRCHAKTYAIAVKGQAFPLDVLAAPHIQGQVADQPRAVVLKASSWAMANCFRVEKELGHHRMDWYIDSRITKGTGIREPLVRESIPLLPKNASREIHLFRGSLSVGV